MLVEDTCSLCGTQQLKISGEYVAMKVGLILNCPSYCHCTSLGKSLGCALYQILGFGSRTLLAAKIKNHSIKIEFLELKWVVCSHFRESLYYGKHFDVYNDFNPPRYIKTACKLNAGGQIAQLQLFNQLQTKHPKQCCWYIMRILKFKQLSWALNCPVEEIKAILDGSISQIDNGSNMDTNYKQHQCQHWRRSATLRCRKKHFMMQEKSYTLDNRKPDENLIWGRMDKKITRNKIIKVKDRPV